MKKFIKILSVMMVMVMTVFCFSACDGTQTAEDTQKTQTNAALDQMNKQLGMPNIKNFQEKKLLKQVYELRDQSNLICYAYILNQYDGKLVYQGKCMGYGLPYSTEYTNPQKLSGDYHDSTALPQADPNGLYAPTSADATWMVMINDDGTKSVEYCEPNIIVSQTKKPARLCESWSIPKDY